MAAIGSTGLIDSNWNRVCCRRSWHTIFNSTITSFLSCCSSLKNFLSFCFGGFGGRGATGCNKSKLQFLSMTVRSDASTTILLCAKNGRPRIMGEQSPGAMIAWMVLDDQYKEGSWSCNLTYSENLTSTFCPFFSIASSAVYGLCRRLRRRQSFVTNSGLIKAAEEPWSIRASNVTGEPSTSLPAKHFQYKWGTCSGDASLRGLKTGGTVCLLTDEKPLLSDSLLPSTVDVFGATYAVGLRDIPKTAATGWMLVSSDEAEVLAMDALVLTAATRLVCARLTRSTSVCVMVLYVVGFGKSLGQSTAWWLWKKLRHFTHPSFSFKSLRSESSNLGHCLRGAEGADETGAVEVLLLLGTQRDEGSLKLFARREASRLSFAILSYSSLSARRTSSHLFTSLSHLRKLVTLLTFSEETFFDRRISIPVLI